MVMTVVITVTIKGHQVLQCSLPATACKCKKQYHRRLTGRDGLHKQKCSCEMINQAKLLIDCALALADKGSTTA